MPAYGQVMRVVEEFSELHAGSLVRVEDRDPALGPVGRMREEYVGRRVVVLVMVGGMLCWRVAHKLLETASAAADVDAEDAVAVKVGLGVPARVVMGHKSGEREPLILGDIPFGVVVKERVTPSSRWRAILLARGEAHHSR